MKFKNYPKEYEDVFTDPRPLKKCNIDLVGCGKDMPTEAYQSLLSKTFREFELEMFKQLVRVEWLFRQFRYDGLRRQRFLASGRGIDGAFGVFMRHYVGYDNRLIRTSFVLNKVATYLDDFFPNFEDSDPFNEDLKYPYEYMNFECLVLVSKMPERLDLLRVGEDKKMGLTKFYDYVINYISCYNEEHGQKYIFDFNRRLPSHIRINKNYEQSEKIETSSILRG